MRRIVANVLLSLLLLVGMGASNAATSVMLWPLDPVIEAEQQGEAVWIQNVGAAAVTFQIRVFQWLQAEGEERYERQNVIVATPPMATIEPGKKQLVRLTRTQPLPAGLEHAFRVVVDELPRFVDGQDDAATAVPAWSSAGLRFQMRYSLPLFVYGAGMSRRAELTSESDSLALDWRIEAVEGAFHLKVRNAGSRHARLSEVSLLIDGRPAVPIAPGLLGYVLPGAEMAWPIPDRLVPGSTYRLQTRLASRQPPVTLSPN